MKRIIIFVMLLASVFTLSACRNREYLPVEVISIDEVKAAKRIDVSQ